MGSKSVDPFASDLSYSETTTSAAAFEEGDFHDSGFNPSVSVGAEVMDLFTDRGYWYVSENKTNF